MIYSGPCKIYSIQAVKTRLSEKSSVLSIHDPSYSTLKFLKSTCNCSLCENFSNSSRYICQLQLWTGEGTHSGRNTFSLKDVSIYYLGGLISGGYKRHFTVVMIIFCSQLLCGSCRGKWGEGWGPGSLRNA